MTPTEFVLWLNGALGVMDDTPTPEQMAKVREKLGEAIGKITADRLLERAEEQARLDMDRKKREQEIMSMKNQMAQQYAQKLDELAIRTMAAAPPLSTLTSTTTPGTPYPAGGYAPGEIVAMTDTAKTSNASILNRIMRKTA